MEQAQLNIIKESIVAVPDYPKPGIMFRDITTLLENPIAFALVIESFADTYQNCGITKIVGTEARGFIFGAPLALALGVGFVPVRKPGKLPRKVISQSYELEYGTDVLELHIDALNSQDKVLIVDDLLATGGTVEATAKLIRATGATVNDAAFVISLPDLGGEAKLRQSDLSLTCLVEYLGE